MAWHGEPVEDDSQVIRFVFDGEGELVRVLLLEEWYDRLQPLYQYFEEISGLVSVESVPDQVQECFDWLSTLSLEAGAIGWIFSFSIIWWVAGLVKDEISLGKFIYEHTGGRWGHFRWGNARWGHGRIELRELPVKG